MERILIDKEKLDAEMVKISLSNKDITRYGDGFEKAMELVQDAITNLAKKSPYCNMAGQGFCPHEKENGKCDCQTSCTNKTTK